MEDRHNYSKKGLVCWGVGKIRNRKREVERTANGKSKMTCRGRQAGGALRRLVEFMTPQREKPTGSGV